MLILLQKINSVCEIASIYMIFLNRKTTNEQIPVRVQLEGILNLFLTCNDHAFDWWYECLVKILSSTRKSCLASKVQRKWWNFWDHKEQHSNNFGKIENYICCSLLYFNDSITTKFFFLRRKIQHLLQCDTNLSLKKNLEILSVKRIPSLFVGVMFFTPREYCGGSL